MRDIHAGDDLSGAPMREGASLPGLRHSIRRRRDLSVAAPDVSSRSLQPLAEAFPAPGPTARHDLPRWRDLAIVEAGSRRKAPRTALPVVDATRDSVTVRAFDLLRTRLRQTTQEHGWVNIAVTAPTSGCGNTFTAVNLALSLSRIRGSRTVLMDFNLRQPGVAAAFDMTPRGSMADFLVGRTPMGDHLLRVSDTLALGLNDAATEDSAETLQRTETGHTLERMRASLQPELVIYDMPPMLVQDDVSAFLPQLDGVLLVSDGTQSVARELLECERMLDGQVPLLGVVLNRARSNSVPRYA